MRRKICVIGDRKVRRAQQLWNSSTGVNSWHHNHNLLKAQRFTSERLAFQLILGDLVLVGKVELVTNLLGVVSETVVPVNVVLDLFHLVEISDWTSK